MLRFTTAGESHGQGLTILVDGFPAGVPLTAQHINHHLARRQVGYGRGGRMQIETDQAKILSGVRFEKTTGAPIALFIENRDWKNWETVMAVEGAWTEAAEAKKFVRPRPGHADLAAFYKYDLDDLRDALERASARETAARVAAGAVAMALLNALGITVMSHVTKLGGIGINRSQLPQALPALIERVEGNDLRCGADEATLSQIRQHIMDALKAGTTLGGEVEVIVAGLPPGLGSYTQWDRKLDGRLAQAVMSIQAVKAVILGDGELGSEVSGSEFHDAIVATSNSQQTTVSRPTNRAGGLEAGVTNGMPLVVRAIMKPIATMRTPLESINLDTQQPEQAHFERSDVTAVPACGVVCEAMVSFILAQSVLEKFGADTLGDIEAALSHYQQRLSPAPA